MKIAIVGASKNREKFSNKAVRAYKENHHVVFPINPNEREIEGLKCYASLNEVPLEIDIVSLYVPPEIGIKIVEDIVKLGIKKVYLNPGSESRAIVRILKHKGIDVFQICSIKALDVDPKTIE